ncbi:hypothetical protein SAMN06265368_0974 [Cohaesibacter gelatinilyticus]|uniref:Uncharacterized protein n=1 Tax=Cohaesibacter gelatinilyticus TaxID=372072 RepID=A0A285NIG6_9HYPH|nr:hypothetical protein SAMN06265368_0974 [Cohaesibacter gelatinilyticus]
MMQVLIWIQKLPHGIHLSRERYKQEPIVLCQLPLLSSFQMNEIAMVAVLFLIRFLIDCLMVHGNDPVFLEWMLSEGRENSPTKIDE